MEENATKPAVMEYRSDLDKAAQGVERLVNETQEKLEQFQKEHNQIKNQLQIILDENKKNSSNSNLQLCSLNDGSADAVESMREQLTNEAVSNARQQVKILLEVRVNHMERKELNEINDISQRTIKNLEAEVDNYRKQLYRTDQGKELKERYENAIQKLQLKISDQNSQLKLQENMIKTLHAHKIHHLETVTEMEAKLNAALRKPTDKQSEALAKYEHQLKSFLLEKNEYKKSLNYTKSLLDETTKREAIAMSKVQESLLVAEIAIREKKEAEVRAKTFKEECTQLADNIGVIMDQAAQQVDVEVRQLKTQLDERNKCLNQLKQNLLKEQEAFKSKSQYLKVHYSRLEEKLKEQLNENRKLSEQLNETNKRMEKLERKMCENERERLQEHHEQHMNEIKKKYENEITNYITINKKLKDKYKATIEDLTAKFEKEIYNMEKENSELKANLEIIKSTELAKVVNDIADESK